MRRSILALGLGLTALLPSSAPLRAETDLDAFMRQVLVRRDDNWKKLQQYILDEREQVEVRGPNLQPIWGERREYLWYIRDGFFVRSPVNFNGVRIGDGERRKYEEEFLRRMRERDRRAQSAAAPANGRQPAAPNPGEGGSAPELPGSTGSSARSANRSSSRRRISSGSGSRRASTQSSAARRSTATPWSRSNTTRPTCTPTVSAAVWRAITTRATRKTPRFSG